MGSKRPALGYCTLLGLLIVLFSQIAASPVSACVSPRSGAMPICEGLRIDPDTDVVVIHAHQEQSNTNILLGPKKHSADHLNIVVKPGAKPLTVVVSHYEPTVIRFSGDTNRVKQVIAMGARSKGWNHVAFDGVESEKVRFLPVVGRNRNLTTSCSSPPKACVPEQYFVLNQTRDNRWAGIGDTLLDPTKKRYKQAIQVSALNKNTIVIPGPADNSKKPPQTQNFPDGWRGELERYQMSAGKRAIFDPAKLLSPTMTRVTSKLPSWDGMASLLKQGIIREAGDYDSDPDLIEFSEAFSARYRSRFDPDFRFRPRIDFVINPIFYGPIPRDLRHSNRQSVTFLRAGLPLKLNNKGDKGRFCLFYHHNKLTYPRSVVESRDNPDWPAWRQMCGPGDLAPFVGSNKRDTTALARLQLAAARNLESHRNWNTKLCRLSEIPEDVKVVVLSTTNGLYEGGLPYTHCAIKKSSEASGPGTVNEVEPGDHSVCKVGHIDVQVDRPGKLFLFLKSDSAIHWKLDVSTDSKITGIATISDRRQIVSGVPADVKFSQYVPRDRSLPEDCRNGLLDANPHVGGPAILLFEMMFERVFGRKIDSLLNKGLVPVEVTDAVTKEYTTFVVE